MCSPESKLIRAPYLCKYESACYTDIVPKSRNPAIRASHYSFLTFMIHRKTTRFPFILLETIVCITIVSTLRVATTLLFTLYSQKTIATKTTRMQQSPIFDPRQNLSDSTDLPDLLHLSIESASDGLRSGGFTSVDQVDAYLTRI